MKMTKIDKALMGMTAEQAKAFNKAVSDMNVPKKTKKVKMNNNKNGKH